MRFSETDASVEWLNQFDAADKSDAIALLDSMPLVGMDAMIDGVRSLILDRANQIDGIVGLYVERELKLHKGLPKPLFKEIKISMEERIRAVGEGPKPVSSAAPDNPEVGSEGILAWLVTEICRQHPDKFLSHPGPDKIREQRVRGFFLVTDFIGSGKRTSTYLTAAWRVRSVKSWYSGKQIQFEIIGYSGTQTGIRRAERHPTRPRISIVSACPTIDDSFPKDASRMKDLCGRYDPISNNSTRSLGFGGTGALIAFAHGCPNNVPRMFYISRSSSKWTPLFGARVTALSRKNFPKAERSLSDIQQTLSRLGDKRLADRGFGYQPLVAFELSRICTRQRKTGAFGTRRWNVPIERWTAISAYWTKQMGYLPQGAPTSPMIANLAVKALDEQISAIADSHNLVYTRYADDLSLSTRGRDFTRSDAVQVIGKVYRVMGSCGLSPNLTKTHILPPGSRKVILGLLVDGVSPRLTREFRAKLRMHLYYLESVGPVAHQLRRKFVSVRSLRNHIEGLVSFAQHIDPSFARSCRDQLGKIKWPL